MIQTYVDIGRELTLAQEEIAAYRDDGNGKGFKAWVVSELGITPQYAYQLINVYEQFGDGKLKLPNALSSTVLREISAPSVPQEAREEVVSRAESGKVTVAQAKEIIQAAKTEKYERALEESAKKAGLTIAEYKVSRALAGVNKANAALAAPQAAQEEQNAGEVTVVGQFARAQ